MIKMKLKDLQSDLETNDLDIMLIYNPKNVLYFTGFLTQSIARLLVKKEGVPILFVPELEYEEAKIDAINCEVKIFPKKKPILEVIKKIIQDLKVKRVGIEENYISKKEFEDLVEKIPDIEYVNEESLINQLRSIKTNEELKYLREAAKIADIGMEKAFEIIKHGVREIEIAASIEYELRKNGSGPIPFDTIVAAGLRSAFPHAKTTNYKIKTGDIVIIDLGAQFEGYICDTSRTSIVGNPSEKQREIYNTVLEAQKIAEIKCRAGIKANELDSIARNIIINANYGDFFNHSLGHGVGLDVHEHPAISFKNVTELQVNNVITIEPGIYIPNIGGVRIEDTIVVKKNRCEILNKSKKFTFNF